MAFRNSIEERLALEGFTEEDFYPPEEAEKRFEAMLGACLRMKPKDIEERTERKRAAAKRGAITRAKRKVEKGQ